MTSKITEDVPVGLLIEQRAIDGMGIGKIK
jgi:hypothetical protein